MSGVPDERIDAVLRRCGGEVWAEDVISRGPFESLAALQQACDDAWDALDDGGWHDALVQHAEEDVTAGSEETRRATTVALSLYRERFGIPFLSAVRSPTADELLMRVRIRLGNDSDGELRAARDELRRIVRHRVERAWVEAA